MSTGAKPTQNGEKPAQNGADRGQNGVNSMQNREGVGSKKSDEPNSVANRSLLQYSLPNLGRKSAGECDRTAAEFVLRTY
jgi:hypothetical protein